MEETISFVLELDKLKGVSRKSRLLSQERYENSAEHSWHSTLAAVSLSHYAEAPLDINKVIGMLLVHDIGEIEAGDVIVFADVNWEERKQVELAAVTRIFSLLPADRGAPLIELWREFEHGDSAEARFARAVDRAMPVFLNLASRGQSWKENSISYERVIARVRPEIEAGCPALWRYLEGRLSEAKQNGYFG
jgi:putative hydrolase of HD superfamily